MLKAFNGLDKNLKFTVDKFENKTSHFLDFQICSNGLTIFRKKPTLNSELTWTPLLCGNGKRPVFDHLLIEQRKYVKTKPSKRTPIDKEICILERLPQEYC